MLSCFVSLETNPRQLASFLAPLAVPVPRPPIFCSLGNVPARSATRHHRAGDEKQSPPSSSKTRPYALPVNCDARNSFRFRSYANCRVSLALCALFSLSAPRVFHNSFAIKRFRTLLKNSRVVWAFLIKKPQEQLEDSWRDELAATWEGGRRARLDGSEEGAVGGDVAVGHAGGVEGEAGIAVAVEQDEAAGGVSSFAKKVNGFAGGEIGGGQIARVG